MSEAKTKTQGAVQTTGHAWDGDLQEFNNPLPTWWLWSFYATVLFAIIYWVLFPAWPVATSFTKGVMNSITFVDGEGNEKTTHWNTRSLLMKDLQEGKHAKLSQEFMHKVANTDYAEILTDAEMMAFTRSMAKGIFGDNCAPCHGAGGAGVIGLFPNLADDDWLWGGTVEDIEKTLNDGQIGFMPAFREAFSAEQLDDVAGAQRRHDLQVDRDVAPVVADRLVVPGTGDLEGLVALLRLGLPGRGGRRQRRRRVGLHRIDLDLLAADRTFLLRLIGVAHRAVGQCRGVLLSDNGVDTLRYWGTGEDPGAFAGSDALNGKLTGSNGVDHTERGTRAILQVLAPSGVAIHRGIVPGGDVDGTGDGFGTDSALRLQQREGFG